MSSSYQFSLPTKVYFGHEKVFQISNILYDQGISKPLIISDKGVVGTGLVDSICQDLNYPDNSAIVFDTVEPNPSISTVENAVLLGKKIECDGIIAVGGGSPMDVAKTVAIRMSNNKDIGSLEGIDKFSNQPLPVIAVPTTAGTGSEVTPFAVITDIENNYKLTIISQRILPRSAILDPHIISNLPAQVAASTGLDALTHAIESFTSLFSSPYSDAFAEKSIDLIGKNLLKFVSNRGNEEAAGAMLISSLFAGMAFAHARLGNAHAMAHPLGGYFNIPHGVANAILLPHIMEYNKIACPEKFARIAEIFGEEPVAHNAVDMVKRFNSEIGIPKSLSAVGVDSEQIPAMAKDAMKSGNILANPRQSSLQDIERLYNKACSFS